MARFDRPYRPQKFCSPECAAASYIAAAKTVIPPEVSEEDRRSMVPLSKGMVAIVDPEDHEELSRHSWIITESHRTYYASHVWRENGRRKGILMHRLLLGATPGMFVDHINGNGLDNRKANLRVCTLQQNNWHSRPLAERRYKGARFRKCRGMWFSGITVNGQFIYLGQHPSEESAARAYDEAARKHFGEFAWLNFPET